MNVKRYTKNGSAALVAGIAGYASYWHMVAVATAAGERTELAHILPLSVDGLMVVASVVMVDDRNSGRRPRTSAKLAFAVGIAASVAANVSSADPSVLGRTVAAWPALALLLVVEMLSRRGKRIEDQIAKALGDFETTSVPQPPNAPTSPGMVALEVDPPEVLAYRQAARELRRTSRLPVLGATD